MLLIILHIVISLLTCEPGEEVYARFGHSAIRVQDDEAGMDLVFNYGLFSFEQPHFYSRFIKGETYYQLGAQYTESFYWDYAAEGRQIYSQKLALTDDQATEIFRALQVNYMPNNREYLYNFVFDNCATRPYRLIAHALGGEDTIRQSHKLHCAESADSTDSKSTPMTYRERIEHCVGKNSIEAFGINLLLGAKADAEADSLFLPECLMNYMAETDYVESGEIGSFPIRKTVWYDDIRLWLSAFLLAMAALTYYDRHRKQLSTWIDILLAIIYVAVLLIVTYLTFFSLHPLVGYGWRLFIIPVIHLCSRVFYFLPYRS